MGCSTYLGHNTQNITNKLLIKLLYGFGGLIIVQTYALKLQGGCLLMDESEGSLEHQLRSRAFSISKSMGSAKNDIKQVLDFAQNYCPESLPLESIQFLRKVLLTNVPNDAAIIMEICDKLKSIDSQDAET